MWLSRVYGSLHAAFRLKPEAIVTISGCGFRLRPEENRRQHAGEVQDGVVCSRRVCGGVRRRARIGAAAAAWSRSCGAGRRRTWRRGRGHGILHRRRRQQGWRDDPRRDAGDVRAVVRRVGHRQGGRAEPGAACRRARRGAAGAGSPRRRLRRRSRRAEPDAAAAARRGDDGGAAGDGAGQAEAAAQGAGARQGGRLRPLVDSARRPDDRRARKEDRGLVDDHHLRPRRHQRAEPQAVRRDLPRQHDRRVPRRAERRGGDGRAAQGAARLRARRQGPRRHSRRHRLLPSERAGGWTAGCRGAGSRCGRAGRAPGAVAAAASAEDAVAPRRWRRRSSPRETRTATSA